MFPVSSHLNLKQELKRLKLAAYRVHKTKGSRVWQIDNSMVDARAESSPGFDFFTTGISNFLKKEVCKLLDLESFCQVDCFGVTAKPSQLMIFGQGEGDPYIHKFDDEPGWLIFIMNVI